MYLQFQKYNLLNKSICQRVTAKKENACIIKHENKPKMAHCTAHQIKSFKVISSQIFKNKIHNIIINQNAIKYANYYTV